MEGRVAANNVSKSMPVLQRLVVNIEALVWDDLIIGLLIISLLLKDSIPTFKGEPSILSPGKYF